MSVGDLDRGQLVLIEDIPVVYCGICDETQRVLTDPFPEDYVLIHGRGLQLLLIIQVEDLDCPRLSLQGDNVEVPVHDSTVGLDGPSGYIVAILQIDDDDFWGCGFVFLFAYADVVI